MASVLQIDREAYSPLLEKFQANELNVMPRQRLGTTQLTSLQGEILNDLYFFAKIPNIEVNVQVIMPILFYDQTSSRRIIDMRRYLNLDLHDIAVMVGLGTFAGSAASVAWGFAFSSPTPIAIAVPVALAGFVGGKIVSDRSRRLIHASS